MRFGGSAQGFVDLADDPGEELGVNVLRESVTAVHGLQSGNRLV